MKFIVVFSFVCLVSGCASGNLDLYGSDGEKVGECTAGFEWHPIGVKHSVNWVLNYCYELALNEGDIVESVSDTSIIELDYSYPVHPSGAPWNKQLAWSAFWSNWIDAEKYGYIVADLENEYYLTTSEAKRQLLAGEITEQKYKLIVSKAKYAFHGK